MATNNASTISKLRETVKGAVETLNHGIYPYRRLGTHRKTVRDLFCRLMREDQEKAIREFEQIPASLRPAIRDLLLDTPILGHHINSNTIQWLIDTARARESIGDDELFFLEIARIAGKSSDRKNALDEVLRIIGGLPPSAASLNRLTACYKGERKSDGPYMLKLNRIGFGMCAVIGTMDKELHAKESFAAGVRQSFPSSRKARKILLSVDRARKEIVRKKELERLRKIYRPQIPSDKKIRAEISSIEIFSIEDFLASIDPDDLLNPPDGPSKKDNMILIGQGDDIPELFDPFHNAVLSLEFLFGEIREDEGDSIDWSRCIEIFGMDQCGAKKLVEEGSLYLLEEQGFFVDSTFWDGGAPGLNGHYKMVYETREAGTEFVINCWRCFRSIAGQLENLNGLTEDLDALDIERC